MYLFALAGYYVILIHFDPSLIKLCVLSYQTRHVSTCGDINSTEELDFKISRNIIVVYCVP